MSRSRLFTLLFAAAVGFLVIVKFASAQQPSAAPVDPDATQSARRLLREIDSLSGRATVSGQHNFPNSVSRYSDRVYELTGKYPGLFGQDLGFASEPDRDLAHGRAELVKEATRQYRLGAVVALTWHAVRPTDEEPVTFHGSVQAHLTDWEWKQVLTPGTDLYNRWCRQVDLVAGYLHELQDADVPVLFRPYHEMNGNWFWWGGRPGPNGSAALYRQLFDRYVHIHHLHNLVWVWNVNSPNQNAGEITAYDPGPGYADVLSMDIYSSFEQQYYDSMVSLAGPTRPIALAEVGGLPALDVLARQPRWTYFMVWSSFEESANTPEQLTAMYHAPNVVNRGDPRLPAPPLETTTTPSPVMPNADQAARSLLGGLYGPAKSPVLLGQEISLDAAPVSQDASARASTSGSLVELTFGAPDATQLLPLVRAAIRAGQVVELRWTPPRPSDGAGAGLLTDYEWKQLITPGTDLNTRWAAQADEISVLLQQLQAEKIAVLWSPYPAANTHAFWWGGRPGVEGSAALVRLLADRVSSQRGIHNLVWVWEPAANGFAEGETGALQDYFPGPLYVDAVALDLQTLSRTRTPEAGEVHSLAGEKPLGLHVAVSTSATTASDGSWRWVNSPTTHAAARSGVSSTQP